MGKTIRLGALVLAIAVLGAAFGVVYNWKSARVLNTLNGYALACASPISPGMRERLDWLSASKQDSIQAYGEFQQQHSDSPHHEDVLKRTGPRIIPAIQDLTGRIGNWTDQDRNLNNSILKLNPNYSFALYLMGLDEIWAKQFDEARGTLLKAKANAHDEKVSDLMEVCRTGKDYYASENARFPIIVVRPLWKGPQADTERKRALKFVKTYGGGRYVIFPIGVCAPTLGPDGGTLEHWIDADLRALASKCPGASIFCE